MVSTPVKDRTPFYAPPEDGVIVKGECPRCHQIRHMFPEAIACSGCSTPDELPAREVKLRERIADIQRERKDKGLSYAQVANRAGVAAATLWHIESGDVKYPNEDTLDWIEQALASFVGTVPTVEEIRERRRKLGVAPRRLARKSGLSQSVVYDIEKSMVREPYRKAQKHPYRSTLLKLEKALDEIEDQVLTMHSIKRRREALGLSLVALNDASGVDYRTIGHIELQKARWPRDSTIRAIDEALSKLEAKPGPAKFEFKRRRNLLGVTQAAVSKHSGIHPDTICEIENNPGDFRQQTLAALDETLRYFENLDRDSLMASVLDPEPLPTPEKIKVRREALGLTRSQLSIRAGLAPKTVGYCESRTRNTWPRTLRTIDKTLRYYEERVAAEE